MLENIPREIQLKETTKWMTSDEVMDQFFVHLGATHDLAHLHPSDRATYLLIQKFHWMPSQASSLSGPELRLCLQDDWRAFLATLEPDDAERKLYVLNRDKR